MKYRVLQRLSYNGRIYDKDEYIKLQATSNKSLQEQVETTQEALDFLLFNA